MVNNYAAFFNCTPVGRTSDSIHSSWLGPELLVMLLVPPGFNWCFSLAPDSNKLFGAQGSPSSGSLLNL